MLIVMIEAIMQVDKGLSTVWTTMMSMERTGTLNIKDIIVYAIAPNHATAVPNVVVSNAHI